MIYNDIREALDKHNQRTSAIGGCSDGYCVVTGKAKGMHTNGGCRCGADPNKTRRLTLSSRMLVDELEDILSRY